MGEFFDIKGFKGLYKINQIGQVLSCPKKIRENYTREETIIKGHITSNGYPGVSLYKDGLKHDKYIHRLIGKQFIPNPENKPQINHKDGDKLNNRLDNLEWVTDQENKQHAYGIGLKKRGEGNVLAKLSKKDVKNIIKLYYSGYLLQKEIASFYNISSDYTNALINRRERILC